MWNNFSHGYGTLSTDGISSVSQNISCIATSCKRFFKRSKPRSSRQQPIIKTRLSTIRMTIAEFVLPTRNTGLHVPCHVPRHNKFVGCSNTRKFDCQFQMLSSSFSRKAFSDLLGGAAAAADAAAPRWSEASCGSEMNKVTNLDSEIQSPVIQVPAPRIASLSYYYTKTSNSNGKMISYNFIKTAYNWSACYLTCRCRLSLPVRLVRDQGARTVADPTVIQQQVIQLVKHFPAVHQFYHMLNNTIQVTIDFHR